MPNDQPFQSDSTTDNENDTRARSALAEGAPGMSTGVATIGFLLCFLAGSGVMYGYDAKRIERATSAVADPIGIRPWSDEDAPVPLSSKDPTWGNRDAPVTIALWSDFQCPFCSRVEPAIDQVKQTYGPEKVRIVWKNEPLSFHDKAKPAAEAAMGVFALTGNDGFWKFHDTVFKNQKAMSTENFVKWAQASGVSDVRRFERGLANHEWAKKVDDDHALATKVGVAGTPAFFVNGVPLSGMMPFEKFKPVIDAELKKAMSKIAAGVAKDRVYVEATKENLKARAAAAAPEEDGTDTKTVFKVPVGSSPVLGKKDARVTIVEFSDFQCPYCKRVEPTLKELQRTYGDKLRLVWKHAPLSFHPRAEPASELTLEARAQKGEAGFWAAHDKLFEHDQKLDDADLEAAAKDLGLDVDKVKTAIKEKKYKKTIDEDLALGEDLEANGTPHFFVNGRRLVGMLPLEKFKEVIDEEIAKADALVKKGIPTADLYEVLTRDGRGAPELEKKVIAAPPANAPYRGASNAKVVIQEFSDYQCPGCRVAEPIVAEIEKSYGDRVKIVWRDQPLSMHADAALAAEAAREAFKQKGNDGFWRMHDLLFKNQQKLKRGDLEGYAVAIGLDLDKFKVALDTRTHKPVVDAELKAGADAGINGTPGFVIGGYFVSGAQPLSKMRRVIDRALEDARRR